MVVFYTHLSNMPIWHSFGYLPAYQSRTTSAHIICSHQHHAQMKGHSRVVPAKLEIESKHLQFTRQNVTNPDPRTRVPFHLTPRSGILSTTQHNTRPPPSRPRKSSIRPPPLRLHLRSPPLGLPPLLRRLPSLLQHPPHPLLLPLYQHNRDNRLRPLLPLRSNQ